MIKRLLPLLAVAALATLVIVQCSKKDKGTTPTQEVVEMNGSVTFIDESLIDLNEITVVFGEHENAISEAGEFTIKGNGHITGLAMACDQDDQPLLMAIVPDPTKGHQFDLDVHSTAIALAFLNPFVCVADPTNAQETIEELEQLYELYDLEYVLEVKLAYDPWALLQDDADIDSALSRLVEAYFNTFPDELSKRFAGTKGQLEPTTAGSTESGPQIDPSWEKSGHRLTWEGGDKFQITNAYGRWAYCCTPTDSFFLFPNGDLLDMLKLKKPFQPSKRTFNMHVTPGEDTSRVRVYGYGFWSNPANSWDSLTANEKNLAHAAGITTVIMEFCTQVIAVVCNAPRIQNNEVVAQLWSQSGWDFILSNSRIMQRVVEYIRADDPWGCAWWLTKQVIMQITTSPSYRETLANLIGLHISESMVTNMAAWLNVPAKVVMTMQNVSSVLKTILGLENSYFKTVFRVWREYEAYGAVEGYVGDKTSGKPIEGATVRLDGDEGNPLNPPHLKTTDEGGYYRFDNIGVGEKTVTASKAGYRSKTVGVVIEEGKTVQADITLEEGTGGLSGRVLNEILIRNQAASTLFSGKVDLRAEEVGGQNRDLYSSVNNGTYGFNLPAGTWWVVASHDDYKPDSFQVVVPQDGNVSAPRDLVLKPDPKMTATIYLDLNNDGHYDSPYSLTFPQVGISKRKTVPDGCVFGGNPMQVIMGVGIRGSSLSDFDFVVIDFNTELINQASYYDIGGTEYFGCTGFNVLARAAYATTRVHCTYEQVEDVMLFTFHSDPTMPGCNCGITKPGLVYLTDWGVELGDLVAGTFNIDMPGWNTCQCSGDDTDDDGIIDLYDVSCARARVEVEFRLLIGTDYLITLKPPQLKGLTPSAEEVKR